MRSNKNKIILGIIILIIATIVAFAPILQNNFINYDDPGYLTKNVNVQSGLNFKSIKWAFSTSSESNWHPLTWIALMIDYQLFGLNPAYHHGMNLLIHLISSIILFLFLNRCTGSVWQSLFVALVFAVHPLHVESVAWSSEKKDILSGLFWILTLFAYVLYKEKPSILKYLLTMAFFLLGLLSKPMLVTIPFILILLDYWPLRILSISKNNSGNRRQNNSYSFIKSIYEKIPFFVISIISSVVTYIVQSKGGSMAESNSLSLIERVSNASLSYLKYIYKTFIPVDLSIFYPHAGKDINFVYAGIAVIALTIITLIFFKIKKKYPFMLVGWLWFIGSMVPVIGLVQVGLQAMADRYMYIPIIGIAIVVAWGLPVILEKVKLSNRHIINSLFGITTLSMVVITNSQARFWKDSRMLFEHAISVTINNDVAYTNLGVDLADSGKHKDAVYHLRKAFELKPNEILIRSNLAKSLSAIGQTKEALEHYNWLMKHVSPDPRFYLRIADASAAESLNEEAERYYLKALELEPLSGLIRAKLGELYLYQNKFQNARQQCYESLKYDSMNSKAHSVLGILAGKEGRYKDSYKELLLAAQLDSTNPDVYIDLGVLFDKMNNLSESEKYYKKAIELNPDNVDAHYSLAVISAKQNNYEQAESEWKKVIQLKPDDINTIIDLAKLYKIQNRTNDAIEKYKQLLDNKIINKFIYYEYGLQLAKIGKHAEAKLMFGEALKLDPSYSPAKIALSSLP
ncbi:MAG: tetratricopeptide repeat protein [Ignavibacteriales bacterium]|nr:tetratricopeptide repeat protein [Ignavibacteriales bacterium]